MINAGDKLYYYRVRHIFSPVFPLFDCRKVGEKYEEPCTENPSIVSFSEIKKLPFTGEIAVLGLDTPSHFYI